MKGEDVNNEMNLNELNVLGENNHKNLSNANGKVRRNHPMITDGNGGIGSLLSIGNEGENKCPLNTNISATGQEIFMIEDAGNKSSKGQIMVSDGRQSSIGHEIFHSKPQ